MKSIRWEKNTSKHSPMSYTKSIGRYIARIRKYGFSPNQWYVEIFDTSVCTAFAFSWASRIRAIYGTLDECKSQATKNLKLLDSFDD